jgi:hypothetical protein
MTEVDPMAPVSQQSRGRHEEVIGEDERIAEGYVLINDPAQPDAEPPMPPEIPDPREATYNRIEELAQNMKTAMATRPIKRKVSDDIIYGIAVAQAGYEGHYVNFLKEIDRDKTPGGRHRLEDKRPTSVPQEEWDKLGAAGMRAVLAQEAGQQAVQAEVQPEPEPEPKAEPASPIPVPVGGKSDTGRVYVSQSIAHPAEEESEASAPEAEAAAAAAPVSAEPADQPGEDEEFVDTPVAEATPAGEAASRPPIEILPPPPRAGTPGEAIYAAPEQKRGLRAKVGAALAAVPAWLGYKTAKHKSRKTEPVQPQPKLDQDAEQRRRTRLGLATFLVGAVALGATLLAFHDHGPPAQHHPAKPPGPVVVTPPPSTGGGGGAPQVTKPVPLKLDYAGGSIWEATVDYADSHGVTLSESQKHDIVGDILASNGQTWGTARHLPVGFRFIISPYEANEILNANK